MISTEEKLAQVQKELEDIKIEYAEFAHIVSHDLGAPLRAIEGFSNIIAEKHSDSFDEKTATHFDYIIDATKNSKSILAALLEYSRLNTKVNPVITCDCGVIFDDVKQQLSSMICESGANIHCEKLPVIFADQHQISLLFYHLLHNALLYRDINTNTVIHMACQDVNNVWKFSISDNGIGINNSQTEKIFKVLKRGNSDKQYSGMGMGLAIAKKIVQRHGGDISVDTELGRGSSFFFTIKK